MSAAGAPDEHERGPAGAGEPSEEELRAAYEAELSRLTATDVVAQATVSLLNIGARRLAPAPDPGAGAGVGAGAGERDLEQVRDAIDAVRSLLEVLERRIPAQDLRPMRDALSQLQMAYARELAPGAAQAAQAPPPDPARGAGASGGPAPGGEGEPASSPAEGQRGPGPAESSGRLWVPGR